MGAVSFILFVLFPCLAILIPVILIGLIIRGFYGPKSPINRRHAGTIQTCLNDFRDDFEVDEGPEGFGTPADEEMGKY